MKAAQLAILRFIALLLLLPGLGGLIVSAVISTHYLDTLPRWPAPEELRMTPRNIHGVVVYQTEDEDLRLTMIEDVSVGVFVAGLGLSLWYLEQWSALRSRQNEEEESLDESFS